MSAPQTSVSVVMCTYNGEKFVREQLQSILGQTRPPNEIIVSDDGSSDSTIQIVEEIRSSGFVGDKIRWKIIERDIPLGVAGNFCSALRLASGEFIALADQDDVWEAERIEKGLAQFGPDVLLTCSDALLVDSDGLPTGRLMATLGVSRRDQRELLSNASLNLLLRRNLVTGATVALRRSLLARALPIPDGWIHDEWLALVAAIHGGVSYLPEPLIRYRQHGGNQIGAEAISLKNAIPRFRVSHAEMRAKRMVRIRGLEQLLQRDPDWLGIQARKRIEDKIAFDGWRNSLPLERRNRLPSIGSRLISGRYHRFSRGWIDFLRDLLLD